MILGIDLFGGYAKIPKMLFTGEKIVITIWLEHTIAAHKEHKIVEIKLFDYVLPLTLYCRVCPVSRNRYDTLMGWPLSPARTSEGLV